MNILIIKRKIPPEEVGGSITDVWELAQRLAILNNNVHIICSTDNKKSPIYELHNNIHIHRFPTPVRNPLLSYLYRTWKIFEIYKRLEKGIKFDIINIFNF